MSWDGAFPEADSVKRCGARGPSCQGMAHSLVTAKCALLLCLAAWRTAWSCPVGHFARDEDWACVQCPAGKYKAVASAQVPDPHPCFRCLGTGEWSPPGAAGCACNAGYGGIAGGQAYGTCSQCPAGKFNGDVADGECMPCSSPRPACAVGFYSADCIPARDHTCRACVNVPGSNAQYISAAPLHSRNCSIACNAGYHALAELGGGCAACAAGTFKAAAGADNCSLCPEGTFSTEAATSCSVCRVACPSGYTINGSCPAGSISDTPCAACPENFYGETGTSCLACDGNARSPVGSPSAASCRCLAGFTIKDSFHGGVRSRMCVQCGKNTFSSFGQDACDACDVNAQAPAGSTNASACRCNAGYSGRTGANRCEACAAGKFKPDVGETECQPCQDLTSGGSKVASSPRASTSEANCSCPSGYSKTSGSLCEDVDECAEDTGTCTPLAHTECHNTPGSFTCLCKQGYSGDAGAGEACEICDADSFKPTVGKGLCTPCPEFSSAPPGSVAKEACACNTGFYGPLGGPCAS